jgi:hypothetical protein
MDLAIHSGRSITFDGRVHITTIDQFYRSMREGEFLPSWANGFTTYGFPLPLFAHPLTSYGGAVIQFFTHSAVEAYAWVAYLGTLCSSLLLYIFFRLQFKRLSAFLATLFFIFAPYRIVNLYVRGALPELIASTFIILTILGVYLFLVRKKVLGLLCVTFGVGLTFLTHPMMIVPEMLIVLPYIALLLIQNRQDVAKKVIGLLVTGLLGFLLSSYYMLPLVNEMKYVHYGLSNDHFREGQTHTIAEIFSSQWSYFGSAHPGPLAENMSVGLIEGGLLFVALLLVLKKGSPQRKTILGFWLGLCAVAILLMTPYLEFLFHWVSLLNSIQYPWRILSALIIIIPIIVAYLFEWFGTKALLVIALGALLFARIPQLYGKNYIQDPVDAYASIRANLHTLNLGTIWMGDPQSYPPKIAQYDIIGGQGVVTTSTIRNRTRTYHISAQTPMQLVDFTTFYPGWLVWDNGRQVPIEFQDPNYRGLITYRLDAGEHDVRVAFIPTRIRKIGFLLSLISGGIVVVWIALYVRELTREVR